MADFPSNSQNKWLQMCSELSNYAKSKAAMHYPGCWVSGLLIPGEDSSFDSHCDVSTKVLIGTSLWFLLPGTQSINPMTL